MISTLILLIKLGDPSGSGTLTLNVCCKNSIPVQSRGFCRPCSSSRFPKPKRHCLKLTSKEREKENEDGERERDKSIRKSVGMTETEFTCM